MSEQVGFSTKHLPDNIEDLSKYVLVGRAQLTAVREAIRAIDKYGLAKEVREQKLQEGQEIAEAVTDAEVVMGRLLKEMPKAQGGRPTENPSTANDRFSKLSDLGISRDQSSQFQRMADHPEEVEKAKEEARENGDIVSRSQVLNKIKEDYKRVLFALAGKDDSHSGRLKILNRVKNERFGMTGQIYWDAEGMVHIPDEAYEVAE